MSGAGDRLIEKRDASRKGCKIWDGATNSDGYPVMRDGDDIVLVHRKVAGATGDKPVHHTCGNRKCVKKEHLKITTHRENILASDGPAARKAKQTKCDKGHSLKDAYVWKDPEGRKHRRCRTCKLQEVKKHLKGEHNQKLHGAWAHEQFGVMSKEKKNKLISQIEGNSHDDTLASLTNWMSKNPGAHMVAWLDKSGSILDMQFAGQPRTKIGEKDDGKKAGEGIEEQLRARTQATIDNILLGKNTGRGEKEIPFRRDRLQKLYDNLFNRPGLKRREQAESIVMRSARGSRPTPNEMKTMWFSGIPKAYWVGDDGKSRGMHMDHRKFKPETIEATERKYRGFAGWRLFKLHKKDHPDAERDNVIKRVKSGDLKMPKVTKKIADDSLDEALEVTAGQYPGFRYYIDGRSKYRANINPSIEGLVSKTHADPEDFAELVSLDELYEAFMREEVSKHYIGRHKQEDHGNWAHERDEHDAIKQIEGGLNIFRSETKRDPGLREQINWVKDKMDYADTFGRDLEQDRDKLFITFKMIHGREPKEPEKKTLLDSLRNKEVDRQDLTQMDLMVGDSYRANKEFLDMAEIKEYEEPQMSYADAFQGFADFATKKGHDPKELLEETKGWTPPAPGREGDPPTKFGQLFDEYLETIGKSQREEVFKHLMGQHDQDKHNPHKRQEHGTSADPTRLSQAQIEMRGNLGAAALITGVGTPLGLPALATAARGTRLWKTPPPEEGSILHGLKTKMNELGFEKDGDLTVQEAAVIGVVTAVGAAVVLPRHTGVQSSFLRLTKKFDVDNLDDMDFLPPGVTTKKLNKSLEGKNYTETLANVEKAIAGKKREFAFLIDKDTGKILTGSRGFRGMVLPDVDQAMKRIHDLHGSTLQAASGSTIRSRDAIYNVKYQRALEKHIKNRVVMTHNHPGAGKSLPPSTPDWSGLDHVRAVTKEGTWELNWLPIQGTDKYAKAQRATEQAYIDAMNRNIMGNPQMMFGFGPASRGPLTRKLSRDLDDAYRMNAQRYGFDYGFVDYGESIRRGAQAAS